MVLVCIPCENLNLGIYLRLNMFVTIQYYNILRADLETDDGAILGLPLIKPMVYS